MARYVADGDEAAFRELFARYAPRLTGMFRRGLADEEVVRDLLQQTFLQLHRARRDFRLGATLRPWLFSIALNLKRRHFRDRGRRPAGALQHDPPADRPDAEAAARGGEDRARLRAALGELTEAQREVIELHWFEGLPMAEVAGRVGASLSAVKVRAHRGYERLRGQLGGDG